MVPNTRPVYLTRGEIRSPEPQSWCVAVPCGNPETSGRWWLVGDEILHIRKSRRINLGWFWYGSTSDDREDERYVGYEYDPIDAIAFQEKAMAYVHPAIQEVVQEIEAERAL